MQQIHENISEEVKQHKDDRREQIEILTRRICLLAGKDKILMTMYLKNGNTFYQMAQLSGVSEATISRRIRRVTKKLIDGEYITCLRNRDKFSEKQLQIAKDYFLRGKAVRGIAAKYNMTYYKAQKLIKELKEFIRSIES